MTSSGRQRRKSVPLELETLESRRLLVAFGTAWDDARDLTISFPSDGVDVGHLQNDLHATLDQIANRDDWQETFLRAYQTWTLHADINIGLRNDYDLGFGTPGLLQHDPRFGDFRIGAVPQEGLLANSFPLQAIAGTYSGDMLLNSNQSFRFHDWDNDVGPDLSTYTENDRDLFSLALHEAGNTFGLEDNNLDWSVMFGQYTVPKGTLAPEDIASIQALYGARTDPYENVDNGQLTIASLLSTPAGFDANTDTLATRASLLTGNDIDYFRFVPLAGQDSATVRLEAEGVSLLKSTLQALDVNGQILSETSSASVFANNNTLELTGLQNHSEIYLRVSAADPADVYSVGDYVLEIDYRDLSVQANDPTVGAFDSGSDELFANFALNDDEIGTNDDYLTPVSVAANAPNADHRIQIVSSVSSEADIDLFKITSPSEASDRLLISLSGVGGDRPDLDIHILDANGYSVGASGRLRTDGTWVMEVAQPDSDTDYLIRISVDPSSDVGVGNYIAIADFDIPSDQLNDLATGDLIDSTDEFIRWTAAKTKLFHFDLGADSVSADHGVRLTVFDAHTREVRMDLIAYSGQSRSAMAWLEQGDYILRFSAISSNGATVPNVHYTLTCDGLSDDQDEDDEDPYDDEYFTGYQYEYVDPAYEYDQSGYSYDATEYYDSYYSP